MGYWQNPHLWAIFLLDFIGCEPVSQIISETTFPNPTAAGEKFFDPFFHKLSMPEGMFIALGRKFLASLLAHWR